MAEPERMKPLVWRVPSWQVAALFLVVAGCAAANIYAHPGATSRLITILIGVVALVMAVAGLRMYLVVDDEGAAVRFFGNEQWLPWPKVARIEVARGVRGSDTVRFTRNDGTQVTVPPSLLQPVRPTSRLNARRQLDFLAQQFDALRTDQKN